MIWGFQNCFFQTVYSGITSVFIVVLNNQQYIGLCFTKSLGNSPASGRCTIAMAMNILLSDMGFLAGGAVPLVSLEEKHAELSGARGKSWFCPSIC